MMYNDEYEHYAPWEWRPVDGMQGGCSEVTVMYQDGHVSEMCSCDYWWLKTQGKELPIYFRYP